MDALKEATIRSIERMPDGAKPEDIMYQVNFVAQVMQGMKDADEGRVITTEELFKRIDSWQK